MTAAALMSLAVLSHGGVAFVLPLVVVLALMLLRRVSMWWPRIASSAVAASVVLAMYTPWILYQRFVSPPGDGLLKWHLAGVVPVDDRTFLRALLDPYANSSLQQFWDARLSNLSHVFDPRLLDGQARVTAALTLASIGCIPLWALALFSPDAAIVHQGSQAWTILLLVLPFAWLREGHPWFAAGLGVTQTALTFRAPLTPAIGSEPVMVVIALLLLVGANFVPTSAAEYRSETPMSM